MINVSIQNPNKIYFPFSIPDYILSPSAFIEVKDAQGVDVPFSLVREGDRIVLSVAESYKDQCLSLDLVPLKYVEDEGAGLDIVNDILFSINNIKIPETSQQEADLERLRVGVNEVRVLGFKIDTNMDAVVDVENPSIFYSLILSRYILSDIAFNQSELPLNVPFIGVTHIAILRGSDVGDVLAYQNNTLLTSLTSSSNVDYLFGRVDLYKVTGNSIELRSS